MSYKDPQKRKEYMTRYYEKNKERLKQGYKERYQRNKEEIARKHREKKRNDIRKIALFLSGKTPPYYIKQNRLEFMELLEETFCLKLEKIDFYWEQAKENEEEFYFLVLDFLYKKAQKDKNEKKKFKKIIEFVDDKRNEKRLKSLDLLMENHLESLNKSIKEYNERSMREKEKPLSKKVLAKIKRFLGNLFPGN